MKVSRSQSLYLSVYFLDREREERKRDRRERERERSERESERERDKENRKRDIEERVWFLDALDLEFV